MGGLLTCIDIMGRGGARDFIADGMEKSLKQITLSTDIIKRITIKLVTIWALDSMLISGVWEISANA
jgi:hypothetical protein